MGHRWRTTAGAARKGCRQDHSHRQPVGLARGTFASSRRRPSGSGTSFIRARRAACAGASSIRTLRRVDGPEAAVCPRGRLAFRPRQWTTRYGPHSATTSRRTSSAGVCAEPEIEKVTIRAGCSRGEGYPARAFWGRHGIFARKRREGTITFMFLALSVEGPQATLGGRGFTTFTSTNAVGAVTTSQNFFINAPGQAGGLLNAFDATGYTVNKAPDIIIKAAADPGYGHYELFGIISTFRNRIFPCSVVGTNAGNTPAPATPTVLACPVDASTAPSALGAFDDTRIGGGLGASLRV